MTFIFYLVGIFPENFSQKSWKFTKLQWFCRRVSEHFIKCPFPVKGVLSHWIILITAHLTYGFIYIYVIDLCLQHIWHRDNALKMPTIRRFADNPSFLPTIYPCYRHRSFPLKESSLCFFKLYFKHRIWLDNWNHLSIIEY